MKYCLYLIGFLFVSIAAVAQPEPSAERLEALRIAYLTKQLDLSTEEAQRFWPVYNEYTAGAKALNQELRAGKLTQLKFEEKQLDLKKKFQPKFEGAVGEEKFEKFLKADREWRDLVRREIEKRRQNMRNQKGFN